MSHDRADQPFDDVERPKHYNSHPSGVETFEVNQWFSGNVAAAIKYVWRRELKEPVPLRDLKKAAWYLNTELQRLATVDALSCCTIFVPMTEDARVQLLERAQRVCEHDSPGALSGVLAALMLAEVDTCAGLTAALRVVQIAIAAAEKEKNT